MDAQQELSAIEQIKRLKASYFRCMDTKDWDGFQAVFAPDATMDTTQEAPDIDVVQGNENIRRFVEGAVGPVLTVHHGHMPEIEIVSDSQATGIWALFDLLRFKAGPITEIAAYGHYYETYEKAEGEWRIKAIRLTRLRVDTTTRE